MVRDYAPLETLKMIYNGLRQPLFDYGDIVWDGFNKTLAQRLQRLQNRAARIITRSSHDVRSADILKDLNWANLEQRRFKLKVMVKYTIKNNMALNT